MMPIGGQMAYKYRQQQIIQKTSNFKFKLQLEWPKDTLNGRHWIGDWAASDNEQEAWPPLDSLPLSFFTLNSLLSSSPFFLGLILSLLTQFGIILGFIMGPFLPVCFLP